MSEDSFLSHLQEPNTKEALLKFARSFIQTHLSDDHLAIFRLLVAEGAKAQEIISSFFAVGPDETDKKLSEFFTERLSIKNVEITVQLWAAMLLAHRSAVLIGMDRPDDQQREELARDATDFLLAAIS